MLGQDIEHPFKGYLFVFIFMGMVVILTYHHVFDAPFVYDDIRNISANKQIHCQSLSDLFHYLFQTPFKRRKLGWFSFAVNYYFNGSDPFGYHLTNICIHILNGFLVFWLTLRTLTLPRVRSVFDPIAAEPKEQLHVRTPWRIAFFTALLWVVHPVQIQAVTYIVQRLASLSALLFLLSFAFYISGRLREGAGKYLFYALSLFSGFMAMGVKENTAILPFLILSYEILFFSDSPWEGLKKRWKILFLLACFSIAITLAYLGPHFWTKLQRLYSVREFTLSERVLTQFRVVFYYLSLIILPLPSRLRLDYDFGLSNSLFDPVSTFFSAAGIVGMITCALIYARKRPLFSFSILWFLGTLAIESSLIPLDMVYEHRLYLASICPIALFVFIIYQNLSLRRNWMPHVILLMIAALLSYWAYVRNEVWTSPVKLWADNAMKTPYKARVLGNLGMALKKENRLHEAVLAFEKALQLGFSHGSDLFATYVNLGVTYAQLKQYEKAKTNLETAVRFAKSIQMPPDDPELLTAYNNLAGLSIDPFRDFGRAKRIVERILEQDPRFTDAYFTLGMISLKKGPARRKEIYAAVEAFKKVLELDPHHPEAHHRLAACYFNLHDYEKAISILKKGISLWPKNPDLYSLLGASYYHLGDRQNAEKALRTALEIQPGDAFAMYYEKRIHRAGASRIP